RAAAKAADVQLSHSHVATIVEPSTKDEGLYNSTMTDAAVHTIERDLREIFGSRLASLVAYGSPGPTMHTMAIVDRLTKEDLKACAAKISGWHDAHLATPLILGTHEFENSLDAFPLEFGAILAAHTVVAGQNP